MRLIFSLLLSTTALFAREDARNIWTAKCKSCHGADGRAQTRAGQKENIPDFTLPSWQKTTTDEQIRSTITNGSARNAKMKAFKNKLKPEEINALVAYIRGLK